jgi:multiple sugar transport system permease protein
MTEDAEMDANRILKKASPYMFLLPAVFVFAVALLYPVLYGVRLSFFQWSFRDIYSQVPKFVGFKNFIDEFQNPQFLTSLRVTTVFIFATMVVEVLVGLVLALLTERKTRGLTIFRTIFILPIMIAPVVVGVIWRYLYNANYGMINYFLGLVGIKPLLWLAQPGTALASIIITDVWQWTPFVYLLLLAGLQTVPEENIEAAVVDGASYFQRLIHVVLPIMKPIVGITIVLRLVDAMRGLVVMYIMTFGGPGLSTEVLSLHIYKTAFIAQRLGRASTDAVLLIMYMLLVALILLGLFRTERRK